jgi:hypothetical protein
MPTWRRLVAPHAERVAGLIAAESRRPIGLPTPLTEANRSAGRRGLASHKPGLKFPLRAPKACRGCGLVVRDRRRTWCDECLPEAKAKQARASVAAGSLRRLDFGSRGGIRSTASGPGRSNR